MKIENISFNKMSGAGNDFVVFNLNSFSQLNLDKNLVKKICDRHFGVGADGICYGPLPNSPLNVPTMRFFNPDGSKAEKSGNGRSV